MLTHYTANFMFALCINLLFNVDIFNISLPARPKETKFSVEATEDGKVRISNLSILKKCYPQPLQVGKIYKKDFKFIYFEKVLSSTHPSGKSWSTKRTSSVSIFTERSSNVSILRKYYPQPIQMGNKIVQEGLQMYPLWESIILNLSKWE